MILLYIMNIDMNIIHINRGYTNIYFIENQLSANPICLSLTYFN